MQTGGVDLKTDLNKIQGGPKNWTIFGEFIYFATVGARSRNACDMSKFSKFYLEKNIKLACQCV